MSLLRRRGMLTIDVEPSEKTWNDVWASISAGTYANDFEIGEVVALQPTTYSVPLYMQIVAFDTDIKADGGGYAPITWIARDAIGARAMTFNGSGSQYEWNGCDMQVFLNGTWAANLPSGFYNHIVPVKKYSRTFTGANTTALNNVESTEYIWIPSYREIGAGTTYDETVGVTYSSFFNTAAKRAKVKYDTGAAVGYRIRTFTSTNARTGGISTSGSNANVVKTTSSGSNIVIGFCT